MPDETLNRAKAYTNDALQTHVDKADPHPQYARLVDVNGNPTGGRLLERFPGQAQPPAERGSVLFDLVATGVFIANEAGTAWVQLGQGAIPVDLTPPSVPGGLAVTVKTTTSLTLTWTASTDAETGVAGYDVSVDGGGWVPVGKVLTYTVTGLAPGSSHTIRVRARDNATVPNLSAAASVTSSTTAPVATTPTSLRLTASATSSLTFAWGAPASGTVARYEWRLAGGSFATNGTATTKQVTGLNPDTPYTFGVRAALTDGSTSDEVTVSVRTASVTTGGDIAVGVHIVAATAADISANPELSRYSGMSQLQVLNDLEGQMRTLTGFNDTLLLTVGHIFQNGSNYLLNSWGTTQLNRYPVMVANFKPAAGATTAGMQKTASGAEDTLIQAMIDSLPAGKRIYLTYFHEPDETGGAFADAWRAATAHWARYILDHRGAKDLHPMICLTTYSFRPNNAAIQAQFLSVTDNYEALGIDWRTQVVMGPDGYQDKAAGKNPTITVNNVNGDAANTFIDVFPQLKAAGWQRFGITETAACSKVGTAGNTGAVTAADVALSTAWAKSVIKYAQTYGMEYVCWFNATGSKGPIGSWMFTDAIKTAWGQAAHYKGPAPGW